MTPETFVKTDKDRDRSKLSSSGPPNTYPREPPVDRDPQKDPDDTVPSLLRIVSPVTGPEASSETHT